MRAPWLSLEPRQLREGGGGDTGGPGGPNAAGDDFRAKQEQRPPAPAPTAPGPTGPTPQQLEQQRVAAAMAALTQAFAGYDPAQLWYDAYLSYANPALTDEYGRARQQLEYALSRSAQLGTELGNSRLAELDARRQQGLQQIQTQAGTYKTQGQQAFDAAKTQAQQTIQSDKTITADKVPDLAATTKSTLKQPDFAPLASLFADISAGIPLGTYDPKNRKSAGVFVPGGGSTPAPVVGAGGSQTIVG